jgi:glycosyltransferase 2 family protein
MTAGVRNMLVGVLLGCVFLAVAAWAVDWAKLRSVLGQTEPVYAALLVPAVILYLLAKTARWRVLIRPITDVRTQRLFGAVCAGNAGNYVIPHFGELLRVMIAGDRLSVARSALLGSIAVERLFDFAALAFLAAVLLLPGGRQAAETTGAIWVVALLAVGLFIAIAAFMVWTDALVEAIDGMTRLLPENLRSFIVRVVRNGAPGLAMMRRPDLMIPALTLSLLQWVFIGLSVAMSLRSVGIGASPAAVSAVVLLNVVGLVLPAAPGHVGTIQLSFAVALRGFGVPWETAIAASIVYNTITVAVVMALGVPAISRAGVRVGEVLRRHAATD